jgi:hypothetical protein
MICIIALIVFGILAIFSASYRPLAAEAFDCVFRRLTFRKCSTGLDKRLKAKISGKFMKNHPKTGKFLYKRFEIISWILIIILVLSIAQSGVSIYNWTAYGNCNGENSDESCPLNSIVDLSTGECTNPLCEDPECNGGCETGHTADCACGEASCGSDNVLNLSAS